MNVADSPRTQSVVTQAQPLEAQWLEVRNPQDDSLIQTIQQATQADVERALNVAVIGKDIAKRLPTHERIHILSKVADLVEAKAEEFAKLISSEGIKTIREARKEAARCVMTLRISAEEARRLTGETIPFDQRPGSENRIGYTTREPLGIITAITPFNDPLNLVAHKLGPAIAAGNAVLLKPASATPLTALKLAECFYEAGLPREVLQVLVCNPDVGERLITDSRVRMVSFTGGREAGERIIKLAGLKKISMELGSNCPTIVMNDADLDKAVADCVSGAFWAAGQNCLHVQRLLVQADVYEPFKQKFIDATARHKMGDKSLETTDMGCMISEKAAARVEETVLTAVRAGATLLFGSKRSGSFFEPTVLENVPHHTRLYQEEIYGPVTLLEKFTTLGEAIQLANSVDYGLQAAIFTTSLHTAHQAIRELEAGAIIVNDSTDYRVDAMPFGGVKGSGLGREGVRHAMLEMSEVKVACLVL
ncbi:MAG: aldehyde dehydrogenase family protein [Trueperaceae bacterium]